MAINITELPPSLAYAQLLRETHKLIAAGQGDGDEAESLADRMDAPWYAMTDQEQRRMRGLSEDLYSIAEGGPKQIDMTDQERASWQLGAKEAYGKFESGDVDAVLQFFRQPVPTTVTAGHVRYFQARCWEKLGDYETALPFMQEAARLDPVRFTVMVLLLLEKVGDGERTSRLANAILNRPNSTAKELYMAASVLLRTTREVEDESAAPLIRRVVQALDRAESMCSTTDDPLRPLLRRGIAATSGLSLERLGNVSVAIQRYSQALKENPNDAELFTMRGIARYPHEPEKAMEDFRQATQNGARLAIPWYILARHSLVAGLYGQALRYAIGASERPGPSSLRAEVFETIAISLAMMAQPKDRVLENFAKAVELNPENARIQRNAELARTTMPRRLKDWERVSMPLATNIRTAREAWEDELTARITDQLAA